MKKYLKLSIFALALILVISGCAQKIKSDKKNSFQKATSSVENKATSSTTQIKQADFWGRDVVVNVDGWHKTIVNKKYGFSVNFPYDFKIDEKNASPEFVVVGDVAIYIATGTVEQFNKDFLKMEGPVANLKIMKIKVADGKIGYVQYYDGEGSVKNYTFLISLGNKKNVLFFEESYEGEFDPSSLFNSIVSTVKIN